MTASGEIRGPGDLCLDADGTPGVANPRVQMWKCHGGANQKWKIEPGGFLRGYRDMCLAANGSLTTEGTPMRMEACGSVGAFRSGMNQRYSIYGPFVGHGGKCLDADSTIDYVNGTRAQLWTCHYGANQLWEYFP